MERMSNTSTTIEQEPAITERLRRSASLTQFKKKL